jgi:hypothetical protein
MNKIDWPTDRLGPISDYFDDEEAANNDPRADVPPALSVQEFDQPIDADEQNIAPIPRKKSLVAFPL